MRPLYLEISAFGPYAGKEQIEMDKLGEHGLYLITGETGAGKTTIFDAICFALFGSASGTNRDSGMLCSKYAKADMPTEVMLRFLHKGKEYTIHRNPEYMRKKQRGDGFTKQKADADLEREDGTFITGYSEVTGAVVELLGVTKEQFLQISMLAQGDFMKLLLADTKERHTIFRNLFHTEKYDRLQKLLKEEKSVCEQACKDAQKSVGQYIRGIQCEADDVLGIEVDKAINGELLTEDVLEVVEQLLEKDLARKDQLEEVIKKTDKKFNQINEDLGAAREIEKTKQLLSETKERLLKLHPIEKQKKEALEKAENNLKEKEVCNQKIAQIQTQLPEYETYEQIEKSLDVWKRELKKAKLDIERMNAEAEKKEKCCAAYKDELNQLQNAGENKAKLEREQDRVRMMVENLEEIKEKIKSLKQQRQVYEQAQEAYRIVREQYRSIREECEQMEQAYRDGQAGILAATLQEGSPCPVCGSVSHPHLAQLTQVVPTQEELKKCKAAAEEMRKKADETSTKAGEQSMLVQAMQQQICEAAKKVSVDEQEEHLEEIIDAKLKEEKTAGELAKKKCEQELIRIQRRDEISALIPNLEQEREQLKREVVALQDTITQQKTRIESAENQQATIKEKLTFSGGLEAAAEIQKLQNRAQLIQKEYEQASKAVQEISEQIFKLTGSMENCQMTLKHAKTFDIKNLELAHSQIQEEKRMQTEEITKVQSRLDANERGHRDIEQTAKKIAELEKKFAWVSTLSDTANGMLSKKAKIMLETYIQGTYFERIIQRANLRLLKMTDGQYELIREKESLNNKSQTGLELSVKDYYNGSQRSVKSLSGGEQFMASLSLALGLSDEVTASVGGIELDTMFVDEGFGSLDTDKTLPRAYEALMGLTEGNKLVGIISHVTDLKSKIDHQIVVTKDRSDGSYVKLIV
ncbi:AAA family ATPase [Eubacterium oxidoreducens]|uniref:Nuclease SbcCD subunit C n=1 Tax=Eubacterium oxidoreducens TaxID=1732 RepID=A0A1G6BKJ9_EUBOX|nr:SMC family ATPase [Eubacterium oxidoreducens]SDB21139.1 exonuclease SbcC [Eubacterium oxidoreducens]